VSARAIVACEHVIEIRFNDNAGARIGLEQLQFVSEPVALANDRVDEVF